MACIENVCRDCGGGDVSNEIWAMCPSCKSVNVIHYFDEQPEPVCDTDLDIEED